MRETMFASSFHFAKLSFFFSFLLLVQATPFHATSHSNPAPVQLLPATALPSASAASAASSSPSSTVPAFPEQSDVAAASCPLDLRADLLPSVSAACSSSSSSDQVSRTKCCPALAAWLYAAYSSTALSARALPGSSASAVVPGGYDLPALPDDSESCVTGVDRALRERGLALLRVNGSCDVAYCYCGIWLRRLTCPGAFDADTEGRWVPDGDGGRRLERDCVRPGLAGCSRCLRTLNQLKAREKHGGNATRKADRECQLMGVTWLLSRNSTLYLPAATSVLRVLMAADAIGSSDPTSCLLSHDGIPLAVGSDQINGVEKSCCLSLSFLVYAFLVAFFLLSLEL